MPDVSSDVGVVAIGRNEGARLERSLASALRATPWVVYVDSGSTDDSVAFAKSVQIEVVELDTSVPFTAARARNAGVQRLLKWHPELQFVQVVDGDCELDTDWIPRARSFLGECPKVGVVCGRRRERYPSASIYNQLCDLEWARPSGETRSCGGDAIFRLEAFHDVGGFDPTVIAGEEPEVCVRIRAHGWTVHRLAAEMTLHDAAMTSFGQFWKRAKRAGHAYAQGADMHGAPPERHGVRPTRSALAWGLVLPGLALLLAIPSWGASVVAYLLLWLLQRARIVRAERARGRTARQARLVGTYTMLAKHAQAMGVLLYRWRKLTKTAPTLIEYKGAGGGGEEKT